MLGLSCLRSQTPLPPPWRGIKLAMISGRVAIKSFFFAVLFRIIIFSFLFRARVWDGDVLLWGVGRPGEF